MSPSTRRTPLAALVPLAAVLLASACASAGSAVGSGADRATLQSVDRFDGSDLRAVSRSRLIIGAEMAASGAASADQAIRRLRPEMLRPRRSHSGAGSTYMLPILYLDEQRLYDFDLLSTIPADQVREVRLLSETEANMRYSGAHPVGALIIRTR